MTQTLSLLLCEVGAADSTSREMLQGERVDGCAVEPTCMRSPGMGREGGLCREQGGGPGAGEGGVLGSNPRGLRWEREAPPARAGFPFLQAQAQAGRRVVGWPACGWGSFPGQKGHDHCLVPGQPLQWTGGGHRPRRGLPRVQRSRLELGLTPSLLPPCLARVPGPQLTGTEWAREGHMRVQADWEGPWVPDPRGLGITFQAAGTQEGGKSSI